MRHRAINDQGLTRRVLPRASSKRHANQPRHQFINWKIVSHTVYKYFSIEKTELTQFLLKGLDDRAS